MKKSINRKFRKPSAKFTSFAMELVRGTRPVCPVTVELKNGTRHSFTARVAKGHPENPMSESEVLDKFRGNAKLVIAQKQAEDLIATVKNLEAVDDVKKIVELLIPAS